MGSGNVCVGADVSSAQLAPDEGVRGYVVLFEMHRSFAALRMTKSEDTLNEALKRCATQNLYPPFFCGKCEMHRSLVGRRSSSERRRFLRMTRLR